MTDPSNYRIQDPDEVANLVSDSSWDESSEDSISSDESSFESDEVTWREVSVAILGTVQIPSSHVYPDGSRTWKYDRQTDPNDWPEAYVDENVEKVLQLGWVVPNEQGNFWSSGEAAAEHEAHLAELRQIYTPVFDWDDSPAQTSAPGADLGSDADDSGEESESEDEAGDPDAAFVQQARDYLDSAGRSDFAEWFATLSADNQKLLQADPQIQARWGSDDSAASDASAWQPAEADQQSAARANAAAIDALPDRGWTDFTVAGFSLLVGDEHDQQHQDYANSAADAASGTVLVRKASLGRGSGSLTFTGVPPAKQEIVRTAVARFSNKDVIFQ